MLLLARGAAAEDAPRRLVLLVQYIASDYRVAVSDAGQLTNAAEYEENLQAAREAFALSPFEHDALASLVTRIAAHEPPAVVESEARELVRRLRLEMRLPAGPLFWPDLAPGERAYAQSCASCHGAEGRGDGPAAASLSPKPSDFTAPSWADRRAPFQLFNTISLGLPGTAMPAFEQGLEQSTRWSLAFYLLTLRRPAHQLQTRPWIGVIELSESSNSALAERLHITTGAPLDEALAQVDSARRSPPADLSVAQAMHRMRAAVLAARRHVLDSRRDDAADLVSQTYYDAVEPAEPALAAVSMPELAEMERRMNALRDAIASDASIEVESGRVIEQLDAIAARMPDPAPAVAAPPALPEAPRSHGTAAIVAVLVFVLGALVAARRNRRK